MKRLTMILAALALILATTSGCGDDTEAEARCERALRAAVQDQLTADDAADACSAVSVERMREISDRVVQQEVAQLDVGQQPELTPVRMEL